MGGYYSRVNLLQEGRSLVVSDSNIRSVLYPNTDPTDVITDTFTSPANWISNVVSCPLTCETSIPTGEGVSMKQVISVVINDTDSEVFAGRPVLCDLRLDMDTSTAFDTGETAALITIGLGDVLEAFTSLYPLKLVRTTYGIDAYAAFIGILKRELNGVLKFSFEYNCRHVRAPESTDDSFVITMAIKVRGLMLEASLLPPMETVTNCSSLQHSFASSDWENI